MTTPYCSRHAGFSLIELMVAMLVGLFLAGGLIYGYMGATRSYRFNTAMSRIQENGRFAVYLLMHDLREAGYLGCATGTGRINNKTAATDNYFRDFGAGLGGFDNVGGHWPMPLTEALQSEIPVPGSDIITLRRAAGVATQPDSVDAGQSHIVTNCINGTIYEAAASGVQDHLPMEHSRVFALNTTVYFLAESSYTNVPSLWRQQSSHVAAEELVPGVEDMQVLYSEDLDGDKAADVYRSAADVTDMDNVISIRIALLMTSLQEVAERPTPYAFSTFSNAAPDDRYLHREFTVTVNLRNRSS